MIGRTVAHYRVHAKRLTGHAHQGTRTANDLTRDTA